MTIRSRRAWWWRAAAPIALAVAASACAGPASDAASDPTPTAPAAPVATVADRSPGCDAPPPAVARSVHTDHTLTSNGTDRTYREYVPAGYGADPAPTPAPLVVDLHGYLSGADLQTTMSGLGAFAERAGFVVATPQGNSAMPYWNAVPHPELPDDVRFVSDLIDAVGAELCIDPGRVYVDGLSNGAFLTSLVACRLADKVAAVAAVAGLQFPSGCAPSRPMPVLAIHGTDDRFVTYDGSPGVGLDTLSWNDESRDAFGGLPFAPVNETLARWAEADGCGTPPTATAVSASVTLVAYPECAGGSAAQLYTVAGGGHTWPGSEFSRASAAVLGPTTFEVDADTLIWDFFEAHPMPR